MITEKDITDITDTKNLTESLKALESKLKIAEDDGYKRGVKEILESLERYRLEGTTRMAFVLPLEVGKRFLHVLEE